MNVLIAMKPTLFRWFTPAQLFEPMFRLAFTDLLRYVTETAIGQESEVDVIGSSAYLAANGVPHDVITSFLQVCGKELHIFYFNNTAPEWRDWGRRNITIDADYNVLIQLGIDPYV